MAGVKESFCPVLWDFRGGRAVPVQDKELIATAGVEEVQQADGTIVLVEDDTVRKYASGYCDRPYDCYTCDALKHALRLTPPEEQTWVCPACVSPAVRRARASGISATIPGHFTEGYCGYQYCERQTMQVGEEIMPPRYSRFLQLVVGRINF